MQIVAAIVVALGALVGVYTGAMYAFQRLSDQLSQERELAEERLDAEAERLQMQLDAEAERLSRQLEHDRNSREVAELRRLIDESATTGLAAGNKLNVFRNQIRYHLDDFEAINDKYLEKMREAELAVERLAGYVERFEVRLGAKNDVSIALSIWHLALEAAWESFNRPPDEDDFKIGVQKLSESAGAYLAYMETARREIEKQAAPLATATNH